MLVSIDNIPANARSLVVLGVHESAANPEPVEPFELPSPPPNTSTLLLTLPPGFSGDLEINLAAFDGPLGSGCLLATGVERLASFRGPDDELRVGLSALTTPACGQPQLMLLGAKPGLGSTSGGESVTLTGWGFKPDTKVKMGDGIAPCTYVSATELRVQTPAHAGLGLTAIEVSTADGVRDTRADLFRFYADPVVLESQQISPGAYDDVGSITTGRYDPTMTNGFCIPLRNFNKLRCSFFLSGNLVDSKTMEYNVGTAPSAAASGDFNADGAPDVVVVNAGSNSAQILLNNKQGFFTSGETISVGAMPEAVAVSDLELDGDLDIVVANKGSNNLTILKNSGGGTFSLGQTLGVPRQPCGLALGDVSLDGKPDIVLAAQQDNVVTVLFNGGSGTFSTIGPSSVNLPVGRIPTAVALGDVDGSGVLDVLAVSNATDSVNIVENRLSGNIQGYAVVTESAPIALDYADINGDDHADIVVPSPVSGNVNLFPSTAGTGFRNVVFQAIASGCTNPAQIAALDLDGDGKLDLVTAGKGCVSVLMNRNR